MKKLWVYGASNCLPWKLDSEDQCWANILSKKLNAQLVNRACNGCDNLYIYHCINIDKKLHMPDDIVIVAWSHPNRKTFVLDKTNINHIEQIQKNALVYDGTPVFFRSDNEKTTNIAQSFIKMTPIVSGNSFFDKWFEDYYSGYEQRLLLKSFIESTKFSIKNNKFFMYFSKESIENVIDEKDTLCYLEYVKETKTFLSKDDLHCNTQGHAQLAEYIWKKIKND